MSSNYFTIFSPANRLPGKYVFYFYGKISINALALPGGRFVFLPGGFDT